MAFLRSSHKAGKLKPQAKSFKELVSCIGQHTQIAPPHAPVFECEECGRSFGTDQVAYLVI